MSFWAPTPAELAWCIPELAADWLTGRGWTRDDTPPPHVAPGCARYTRGDAEVVIPHPSYLDAGRRWGEALETVAQVHGLRGPALWDAFGEWVGRALSQAEVFKLWAACTG